MASFRRTLEGIRTEIGRMLPIGSSHPGKGPAISPEPPVFGPAMGSGAISTAPSAAADRSILSAILATKITERLFLPREPLSPAARRRFAAALVLVLLVHAGALYALLHRFAFSPKTPEEQEIPVEVVMVPPPPPPPPAPKQPDQPAPNNPPPPPELQKPGTEVPRAANNETIERKAPDDVSKAPQVAPLAGQSAQAPQADKAASAPAPVPTKTQAKAAPPVPTSAAPDAEPLTPATAKQDATEQNDAEAQAKAQEVESKRMAALLAGMEPLPDFKFGAAARPTPVSGGKGENTYLNILYGMIMPHMLVPKRLSASPPPGPVVVAFQIDGRGRLVSQSVVRSSGSAELDMAALFAVREGGPFPAPPGGVPIGLTFTY